MINYQNMHIFQIIYYLFNIDTYNDHTYAANRLCESNYPSWMLGAALQQDSFSTNGRLINATNLVALGDDVV